MDIRISAISSTHLSLIHRRRTTCSGSPNSTCWRGSVAKSCSRAMRAARRQSSRAWRFLAGVLHLMQILESLSSFSEAALRKSGSSSRASRASRVPAIWDLLIWSVLCVSRPFRDDAGQATSAERQHNEHLCFATAVLYALRHLMPAPLARVLRPLAASKRHKDALLRHARVYALIIALHNNPSEATTHRGSISGPSTCSPETGYEHDE